MKGSLPPNSRINLCRFWLAISATRFPALVLPVIDTASMLDLAIASPTL